MEQIFLIAPCSTRLPLMYLPRHDAELMKEIFIDHQHSRLTNEIGMDESRSFNFTRAQFAELLKNVFNISAISGLRVYFGSVIKTSNPSTDMFFRDEDDGKLVLIFAPTVAKGTSEFTDVGTYFIKSELLGLQAISPDLKDILVENYEVKRRTLSDLLGKDESQSVWYPIGHLVEFKEEFECVVKDHPLNGVTVFLAAYQNPTLLDGNDISLQMCVIFTLHRKNLTNDERILLYFEEKSRSSGQRLSPDDYDTGNPCPPNTCDPPPPLTK